jgi:hypothetical protein
MNLYNGQIIKLRMVGSDKLQQGVVRGDNPESQYIEIINDVKPFRININDTANLYQIII